MKRLRALLALAALLAAFATTAATAWADVPQDQVVLSVPQRSQVDGTVWSSTDCGPASIAMVLGAFGQDVPTTNLRKAADQFLGFSDPSDGTRIQDLAQVVKNHGLRVDGPYSGANWRRWSLDDVRTELRAGRPVVAEVYFALLPNHRNNPIPTDHYVVIVGYAGDDFLFNDPADTSAPGYRQRMSSQQFLKAWGASAFPFAAFSAGPPPPPPLPVAAASKPEDRASVAQASSPGAGAPMSPVACHVPLAAPMAVPAALIPAHRPAAVAQWRSIAPRARSGGDIGAILGFVMGLLPVHL